jgi:YVTN family beta-propeller protein
MLKNMNSMLAGMRHLTAAANAILIFCAASVSVNRLSAQNAYVNFEGKQTSPIRLSADGNRLFAVNTPDARLSVFDLSHPSNPALIAEIPVGLEPVSVNPRTSDEVWVVNEVSDSISIVSVSRRMVTDTLYVQDEPADVVFANGKAFVSAGRRNQIVVFDTTNHTRIATIPVFGEDPRALTASTDGAKVYAAFALSGNHTTLIGVSNAPAQSPPSNTNLPAPPRVGLIVDASDPAWTNIIHYSVADNDVVEIDAASLSVSRYFTNVGTILLGIAVRPDNGDLYVANTEARNLVHFEPNLRGHLVDNRVTQIAIGTGARSFYDLNPAVDYGVLPNLAALTNALAQPTAIVFDPSGNFLYVAAFGSDRIARVDSAGTVLARIEIGNAAGSATDSAHKRGPRGLALNAASQRLYVLNRISNTLTIINTADDSVLKEIPVGGFDPTPAVVRDGRGFLYDAKLSGNGTASCASCHPDGEMDRVAWDLGDPGGEMQSIMTFGTNGVTPLLVEEHPMKGPMMVQTLRGLKGLQPFHWRGDRTNFSHFNIAFDGLMGGSGLSSNDITAYSAFIDTVVFEPNPNQNLDRSVPTNFNGANAANGRAFFNSQLYAFDRVCVHCHVDAPGTGAGLGNRIALPFDDRAFQNFKIPHLRNVYQQTTFNNAPGGKSIAGFGMTHDGSEPSVSSFLRRPQFPLNAGNAAVRADLEAYMLCFDTGMAPAVGYARTMVAANVNSPSISNDWLVLEGQARTQDTFGIAYIDLIAKGTLDNHPHGLLYDPVSDTYLVDWTNIPPLTHAELQSKILAGDTLTFMGVPPGCGNRMALDRDANGVRDADEPPPKIQVTQSGNSLVLSWPYASSGFVLESATALANPVWALVPDTLEIVSGQNVVALQIADGARFFRLRSL